MTPKTYKIHVITRDSLGTKVAEYDSVLNGEDYRRLISEAEECDGFLVVRKDCEVDGGLGWRDLYLN